VTTAQPAGGQALGATAVTKRRFRLAPVTTAVLGALGLVLIAAWVLLTFLTRDVQISRDGAAAAAGLACGVVGALVARRQLQNPEGWLLLGAAVGVFAVVDSGLYAVLDYRVHRGRRPLGEIAVICRGSIGPPLIFLSALVILLFPDGRLTRRWTWVLRAYLALTLVAMVGFVANEAGVVAGQHIQVDLNGTYPGPGSPAGVLGGAVGGRSRNPVDPAVLARVRGPADSQLAARIGGAPPAA
jgi:hypothetical protein